MFDWDDLRHLLAVAQYGSALAAGRALRVDQSTVQRRIAELERCLGQQLVRREAAGYRLTEFGLALLPHAQRVGEAVAALEQRVEVERRAAVGVVRVTCPEPIVARLGASGLVERFHTRYPGLRVEFVMSDRFLDLTRGEVDVALRSGDTDDGALVGRKIGDSLWAVYASRDYVERHGRPTQVADLAQHALIGFDAALAKHRVSVWLQEAVPQARIVVRNDSVLGLLHSAKAGVGIAALPTAIADGEASLMRLLGPIPELTRIWRILTTAELRRTPRVAAFFDHVVGEAESLRAVFSG
ncbi:MAG: LysR family transcriptional regulator [Piscinibacter sp.]